MALALDAGVLAELRAAVPGDGNVLTAPEDLLAYGFDGTWYERAPLVVVRPGSVEDVAAVHRIASRARLPIVPRAMGSGLSGGAVPASGSIVLAIARMNRILEIDETNGVAVVEPGVITADLQRAVEARGLFYPPDPSSLRQSAIGGNIAENAGGARCLKYGVTSDYVQALQVVLADGTVFRTGGKMVKNVTGYDLRRLFTGAEGTLGTIVEATLRLLRKPRFERTALAEFPTIDAAARAVNAIVATGVLPTSIELLDRTTLQCVETYLHAGLPTAIDALLLIGVDGNDEAVLAHELAQIAAAAEATGARHVRVARDAAESAKLWEARRAISPALARTRPHKLGEDISVPRSTLPEVIAQIGAVARECRLTIPIFGHIGDGNLHPNILCDRNDPEEMARVRIAARRIFEIAVAAGGTLSGEHGIGLLKKQFLELDLGPAALEVMRGIKHALDPLGIMNPGKIFPDAGGPDAFTL